MLVETPTHLAVRDISQSEYSNMPADEHVLIKRRRICDGFSEENLLSKDSQVSRDSPRQPTQQDRTVRHHHIRLSETTCPTLAARFPHLVHFSER